ncbi:MAG: hypothetical protein QXT77_09080 [Candidatus Methanomethylicaceae archaeon]
MYLPATCPYIGKRGKTEDEAGREGVGENREKGEGGSGKGEGGPESA